MLSSQDVTRIKTAFSSSNSLNEIERYYQPRQDAIIDRVVEVYVGQVENVVLHINDNEVEVTLLQLASTVNLSVFTHLSEMNCIFTAEDLESICQSIISTYYEIVEYENHGLGEKPYVGWWVDANEYGLTSYRSATKHFNMS